MDVIVLVKEIETLRLEYEKCQKRILDTPHSQHREIVANFRLLQPLEKKLRRGYKKLNAIIIDHIKSTDNLDELIMIRKIINANLDTYSPRFLERGKLIAEAMIQNGIRGPQLNQLLEAMRQLGYDIGELEEEAQISLLKEKKIRKLDKHTACIFINSLVCESGL